MKLSEAKSIAQKYLELFRPHCLRIAVAGSVRREKPEVGDLEIICIPETYHLELFLRKQESFIFKKRGPKYQQIYLPLEGINLDLFICDYSTFGCNMVIGTGSADYSKKFMIEIRRRGFFCKNARLYKMRFPDDEEGELVPTPDEASVFKAAGIVMLPPQKRA